MSKKILLADDSVTIQKVVELTFVEGDYEVTCVSNGKAAVQKIQEARPDVLLCDVIMPEMNGYEVSSFIKKNPTYSGIPVILLTGTFEPFDEEKARASGADTYITKPFDSRLLVEKVEELISRRAVFAAEAAAEPVQVFHSRQEFTLQAPPPPQPVEPLEAPSETAGAPPSAQPFLGVEAEFVMPAEQEVGMGTVQALGQPPEPPAPVAPEPPTAPSADESPFMESPFAPAAVVPEAQPPQIPAAFAEAGEAVDLGPMKPEDAMPEAEEVPGLARAHEFLPEPGEVVLPPEALVPPAAEEEAAVTVSGAEDWGSAEPPAAEQKWASFDREPEAGEAEIIHSMADQQEMVSEAQAILDQQRALEGAEEPVLAEAVIAEPSEGVSVPEVAAEAEQTPFVPEEGIETGLPEIMEVVPAAAPTEPQEEPEATVDREILPGPPEPEVGGETPSEEPLPGIGVALLGVETPASVEPGVPEPELEEVIEPVSVSPPPPAAPPHVEIDRAEVERIVRQVVEELAPALIREVAAGVVPEMVKPAVAESVEEEARKAVAELAPPMTRQAAEGAVQEAARQAVLGYLPETVPDIARAEVPAAVRSVAEPLIPGVVRQVAEESAQGTIRQVAESMVPSVLAETLQSALPELVGEQLKALLPELIAKEVRDAASASVKEVAWEVIPELAESLIKRRIQELEAEVG
jgi:CheY-like chemotaxis protein